MEKNMEMKTQPLVLVVDDDVTIRYLICQTLQRSGFLVAEAGDGRQSLDAIERLNPDAIILDAMMPVMDGFATCEALRQLPGKEHLPVLMLTALDDIKAINRAYEMGITDFCNKPINWVLLGRRVEHMLRTSQGLQALRNSEAHLVKEQNVCYFGTWQWDMRTDRMEWSDEMYRIFGLQPQRGGVAYGEFLNCVHKTDRQRLESEIKDALESMDFYRSTFRIALQDGTASIVSIQAQIGRDETARAVRMVGTLRDISERMKAEEQLRLARRVLENKFLPLDASVDIADEKSSCLETPSPSEAKVAALKRESKKDFHGLVGATPKMQQLYEMIEKVAADGISTVLILGESGAGKELVARAIHENSPRKKKNFVPVNCAAIPDELLESELFGYVKGAFTGATQSKLGRFQYADGGTIFLDEIGDMKPSLQAKLLRVLQEKEIEPVGGVKPIPVDVRVVAATHRNLEEAVNNGTFRADLYYRLHVIPLTLPPLRERKEDIPVLIERFVQKLSRGEKGDRIRLAAGVVKSLQSYPWPGNVRELENLIQRLTVLHRGKTVTLADLPDKYTRHASADIAGADLKTSSPTKELDFNSQISDLEDRLILQALRSTGGNKKEAARLLNLKRTTLIEKIKKKHLPNGYI